MTRFQADNFNRIILFWYPDNVFGGYLKFSPRRLACLFFFSFFLCAVLENSFCHPFSQPTEAWGSIYFPATPDITYPFYSLFDQYHNIKIAIHYNIKLVECIITDHTHISIKFCSISLPAHVSSFVNLRIYRTPSWVNSTVVPGYDISPQNHCYTTTNRFSYSITSFCHSYPHTI